MATVFRGPECGDDRTRFVEHADAVGRDSEHRTLVIVDDFEIRSVLERTKTALQSVQLLVVTILGRRRLIERRTLFTRLLEFEAHFSLTGRTVTFRLRRMEHAVGSDADNDDVIVAPR